MKKKLVKRWLYLGFSGVLIVLVCMILGCKGQSKEIGAESKDQEDKSVELQVESKEQEAEAEEQLKIQPKNETNQTKSELSKEEKKKIEKRVLEIVKRIEKFPLFRLEDFKSLEDIKKKDVPKEEEMQRLLKELVSIGKAGVPTLIKVIKDKGKDWQFRALIIYAIVEEIKDDRIVEHLIEIMNDKKEDIVVRNEIVGLLNEKFGKNFPEIEILDKEKGRIEKEVKKTINSIDKKCKLIMKDYNEDDVLVSLIIDGDIKRLRRIGNPGIPFMIEAIKDKKRHWYCRIRVFETACIIKDKRIVKPLMEILEDKTDDSRVRSEVAENLSSLVGAEYLLGILKDESDTRVRIEILRAVGVYLKDEKAIETLVEALNDENEIVAVVSVDGLGFIGTEKVIEPLINALKNNRHALVRARAAEALGRTKNKRAIEPLIENLKMGDMWAAQALGELGKEMEGNDRDRIVEVLIESLKYKDGLVIREGASALGKIGDKRAVEPLIEALWETKGSTRSWLIIGALEEIGDKRAIEPLKKALQDERYKNARINLLSALAKLTGEDFKSLDAKYKDLRR